MLVLIPPGHLVSPLFAGVRECPPCEWRIDTDLFVHITLILKLYQHKAMSAIIKGHSY